MIPSLSLLTLSKLTSTHITVFPLSAKQVPVTSPTYPVPIIPIVWAMVKSDYIE